MSEEGRPSPFDVEKVRGEISRTSSDLDAARKRFEELEFGSTKNSAERTKAKAEVNRLRRELRRLER